MCSASQTFAQRHARHRVEQVNTLIRPEIIGNYLRLLNAPDIYEHEYVAVESETLQGMTSDGSCVQNMETLVHEHEEITVDPYEFQGKIKWMLLIKVW